MNINHTYYIEKRQNSISLNGNWQFCWTDTAVDTPADLSYPHTAPVPSSVYRCLHKAGVLPDPYFGDNSHLYTWADQKIWYFRRSFFLPDNIAEHDVYLCFDGVGYICRLWLNGKLLCTHEGMFGGPILNLHEFDKVLHTGTDNDLIVEVTPPYPDFNRGVNNDPRSKPQIIPWNLRRDASTSNGDFSVFGIWRGVRIEILPKYHISRPYLYTESVHESSALLSFSVEIADPQIRELDCVPSESSPGFGHQDAYRPCLSARPLEKTLGLRITITEKETGKAVYHSEDMIEILDKAFICKDPVYRECQFFTKDIRIDYPQLWWPNTLGSPFLYHVSLELTDAGQILDRLSFDTGIRTVNYQYTAGGRHRTRWEKLHFIVNDRPIFLKGMNWTPVDFLLDVSDADLRWTLELAKNEGVQLIRVWSGGGMPEDDRFYEICDELGLMVMQDNFIANQTSDEWDRRVLASQVCQNLYRIRNHPSLTLHTGGNENNPYALGNDAAMWVISREIEDLDPSRKFWRTTAEKGTTHIYRDMEPVWYRKIYDQLPFIGESGIHSFPNTKTLRQQISSQEFNAPLENIFTDQFTEKHPELYNHFTEYSPSRVPRMLSRASMFQDIHGISLPDLCEATQMASYEFYQIMIQAMRENYPVCGGIMPWVFKRPWATVAIQLVDGLGDTTAPYYAVKNAYAPLMAELALREVTYAPGETFRPDLRLICDDICAYTGLTVRYELYSPTFSLFRKDEFTCDTDSEKYICHFPVPEVTLPEDWNETYFFQRASVYDESGMIHQSFYWCKVLERFRDQEARNGWRSEASPNLYFENGPWLKPQLAALSGSIRLEILRKSVQERFGERWVQMQIRISNTGNIPLFPVKLDVREDRTLAQADDNFYFMEENTSRVLTLHVRVRDPELQEITVTAGTWECTEISTTVSLD